MRLTNEGDAQLSADIERLTRFEPRDLELYRTALRHRSSLRRRADTRVISNERLEYLGDALLGFVVADYLYHRFRSENEGYLTRLRSKLVNGQALARAARTLGLGEIISMSDNMVQKDGRDNPSILADALEATIGAIYLDLGLDPARDFIHHVMLDDVNLAGLAEHKDNFKSLLLEHVQAETDEQPRYELVSEDGPGHSRRFTVEVFVGDRALGRGTAGNKKSAEQRAAKVALERLTGDDGPTHREIR
jgi:ribonuclease-3